MSEPPSLQTATGLSATPKVKAFAELQNLIGDFPDMLHGWAISADFALQMLQLLLAEPPELVLEFGSGTSTDLLLQGLPKAYPQRSGSAQAARSAPQLLTHEHPPHYHHLTTELIAPSILRRHAQLLLAPLESWCDASGTYRF